MKPPLYLLATLLLASGAFALQMPPTHPEPLPETAALQDEVTGKTHSRFGTGASPYRLAVVDLREVLDTPLS